MDRQKANRQFGDGLFDKAVEHHQKMRLVADPEKGETRNKFGNDSQFLNYDWAHIYKECPHFIWGDFFRGSILNSCSRMARGLNP